MLLDKRDVRMSCVTLRVARQTIGVTTVVIVLCKKAQLWALNVRDSFRLCLCYF